MHHRTICILAALLLPVVACDPTAMLQPAGGPAAMAAASDPAAAPPAGGGGGGQSCTVDNSDPNYTCTTCTTAFSTIITCEPKAKAPKAYH